MTLGPKARHECGGEQVLAVHAQVPEAGPEGEMSPQPIEQDAAPCA